MGSPNDQRTVERPEGGPSVLADAPAPRDAQGSPSPSRGSRPRRQAVLVGLGLLLGALAFAVHAGSWVGHNGDHYYYTATALEYAGVPYDQAISTSAHYFHYTMPTGELDRGSLNPWVAPLMYPRDLLPLLALPTVKLFGVAGIWVPGVGLGLGTLLGLVWLVWRRVGTVAAVALPVLLLGSVICTEYMFGVYTEAPLIFLVASALFLLPLGGRRRGWGHAVGVAALVPLTVASRQVPVLVLGMVLGGWLWALVRTRTLRNPWSPFLVTVAPTAAAAGLVMARWAPFDPLQVLRAFTGGHSLSEMLRGAAPLFHRATTRDIHYALGHDRVGVALFALAMVGLVAVIKTPLAGVFAGALGSGLISAYLSPSAVHFRYESPVIPVLVVLGALGVDRLVALVRRVPWTLPEIAGAATGMERPERQERRPAARRPAGEPGWVTAAAMWSVVALVVAAVVALHQPAPTRGAPSAQVSRSEYGRAWPFTVPSGTLTCAGSDYEVWFRDPDGTTYALSGTAMMRSILTPRALALKAQRGEPGWREVIPLLSRGMRLCGRRYMARS